MKRLLPLLLIPLASCSATDSTPSNTIAPLNTTGITTASSTTTTSIVPSNEMFLSQVHMGFGGQTTVDDLELLARGQTYCDAAKMGMSHGAMHLSINEAAYTPEQASLEHVILHQALTWLCPEQEYRVNP